MSVEQILAQIRSRYAARITHWERIPAVAARTVPFPSVMAPDLQRALRQKGIESLYTHQGEAFEAAQAGRHVVVVTPTASGKTLCYNLPVLQRLLADPEARALYLFPTKALSQDQMLELHTLSSSLDRNIKVYTFDGDTPASARRTIRSSGHLVITNPDMLHTGILPQHTNWIRLFENLRYVIIDELHHYRGVFGSHLANVIRRLKRICEHYDSHPQFICSSATIANPVEMAEKIVAEDFALIDNNGAPQGERHFIFYDPEVINPELGIRRSVVKEASRIASRFVYNNIQTIVFARSRVRVELLATYLRRQLIRLKRDPNLIKAYRGGFLPLERRAIEKGLRDKSVLGVVSTNALELGIDIGQLDVSILAGYPGTIASTWQQGGRAGRRRGVSVVMLMASSAPLDQFIIHHPEYFFGKSPENGIVNPNNLAILSSHLKCGAFELPFVDGESFGLQDISGLMRYLEEERILRHTGGRWFWASEAYPAEDVPLRSAATSNFVILNLSRNNEVLGEVDRPSAPLLIHPQAIYLHQGQQYIIENLDWDNQIAYAREVIVDYYTDAQAKVDLKVLQVDLERNFAHIAEPPPDDAERATTRPEPKQRPDFPPRASHLEILPDGEDMGHGPARRFGEVAVSVLATRYKKIKLETHESVGYGDIHLPQEDMQTEAYWADLPPELCEVPERQLGPALQGLSHALRSVIPLYVMCDPKDISAVPEVRSPFSGLPAVFIYDNYPGGVGISQKVYDLDKEIWEAARDLIRECGCRVGCPSCVGPPLEVGEEGKGLALRLATSVAAAIKE